MINISTIIYAYVCMYIESLKNLDERKKYEKHTLNFFGNGTGTLKYSVDILTTSNPYYSSIS